LIHPAARHEKRPPRLQRERPKDGDDDMDCITTFQNATSGLDRLLVALANVRSAGDGKWQARCPAHDDQRASLTVTESSDGTVLVHCHANCATPDVLAAVGLKLADLFPYNGHANGKPRIVASYDYRDADGVLIFQVVRFDPKDFRQRRPDGNGGWTWSVKGCPVLPYRLPELLAADPAVEVFVVEGEKDVDRLRSLGLIPTCNAGGAGKWKAEHAKYLAGRRVVVLPDNDSAGRKHAQQVAQSLVGLASSITVVELPGLADKGDVSDWLDSGGTAKGLLYAADITPEWIAADLEQTVDVEVASQDVGDAGEKKEHKSQATMLVELAGECDLFHDVDGEAFARFQVGDGDDFHWEVSRVRNKGFRRWLSRRFYRATKKTPSAQSLQDALGVIEAKAIFDGDKRSVYIRVAEHDDKIYLDLGSDRWQAIEIDRHGWRIVDDAPVVFRRGKSMLSLPTPVQGSLNEFRRFANVTDDDWPLLLGFMVAAMRPNGPYPVLAVYGEHGSAKSTLCRYIRRIIDPNISPLRADYREPRDLMICANGGWVVALDNLSTIKDWLSDCLCRLSTGGGFATRTLYENDEETIFDAKRPVILNCIEEVVTRSDLLDRCVLLNLPRIDGEKRIPEAQLDREFDGALPSILGGLLTAVSTAMRNQNSVNLSSLPRMADFAIWATAAEPALGLKPGEFVDAYTSNRAAGNETAIEASPVGKAVIDFVAWIGIWTGTSTELLKELDHRVDDKTKKLESWPSTARTLGAAVKRLAPNLREAGLGLEFGRTGRKGTRTITLIHQPERGGNPSSATSASSAVQDSPHSGGLAADANADAKPSADANGFCPSSAASGLFPEENGHADATDNADAKIPAHSNDLETIEI